MTKRVSSAWISRSEAMYGWAYLFIQLLFLPSVLKWGNGILPHPLSNTELNFTFLLINFLAVSLIFRQFLADSVTHAIRHPFLLCQAVILGLAAYYAGTWLMTTLIHYIDPKFVNVNDDSIARMSKDNWYLMAVGTVFFSPLAEECFYRGLVFRSLYPRSAWAAYVLSMLVFSAIHIIGYVGKFTLLRLLLCFVQYLPAGLCLAWSYTKADTIAAPILMHAFINAWSIQSVR